MEIKVREKHHDEILDIIKHLILVSTNPPDKARAREQPKSNPVWKSPCLSPGKTEGSRSNKHTRENEKFG